MKPGVVAMVPDAWGGPWMPRHQILTRLALHVPVVWVDQVDVWQRHVLHSRSRHEHGHGIPKTGTRGAFIFYRANRLLGQYYRPAWLSALSRRARVAAAIRRLKQVGCDRFVLYLWRPEFEPVINDHNWSMVLYHIDDEYSFDEDERATSEVERRVIEAADQVIIHSPLLMERKGGWNPRTALIPNGVDYQGFSTPVAEPADLASIPHPRIGYVGVIKKQLDLELLAKLAERMPEHSFVLVGPTQHAGAIGALLTRLESLPNVFRLGEKTVGELPGYMQHLDVGLLPYRMTAYTNNIFPLKLTEYLAAGLPVVSAPIRTVRDYEPTVSLAENHEQWVEAIKETLRTETGGKKGSRQALARQHDWDKLTAEIWSLITDGLSGADNDMRRRSFKTV